jgi:lipoate-protein ligase A
MPSPVPVEGFFDGLADYFARNVAGVVPYELADEDIAAAERLARDKYSTWEWNFGRSPAYNMERESRLASGTVSVKLLVERGVIKEIHIFGDFFGLLDKSALESALTGTRHETDAIRDALRNVDVGSYISGMTADQLVGIIA